MGQGNMTIRAVLCDIYKTLLDVGPPPLDAEARWSALCRATLEDAPAPGLAEFGDAAKAVIEREHALARSAGISSPEILWPTVAREAWASLSSLDERALADFLLAHAQLQRTVRLMPGVADVLRSLSQNKIPLGLVSNAQPYTLRELDAVLPAGGLSRVLFAPDLCFLSFEHGFSKPDPHVFRLLASRLARRGIKTGETLVVGDREDNDIAPARAQGFRTWRLMAVAAESPADSGDWAQLARTLGAA
jgi:putative hydrolase of the HAD superfamily